MKFLDLFAGIGGFRMGMEMAWHNCVGFVEIDKFARKSYEAIFDTEGEWTAHDITRVTDDDIRQLGIERGRIHVITAGFPCQAFSVAGKRGGFNDTRGTLFFEIVRFAHILRPHYLFLENVPGILNHDQGNTFETIIRTLDEIGYDAEWDCLNSKDFGVPQNRDRLFIIGHSRRGRTRKVFPIDRTNNETSIKRIQGDVSGKGYDSEQDRVYFTDGLMGCLPAARTEKVNVLINKQGNEIKMIGGTTNCIDANYFKGLDAHQQRTGVLEIRPVLTPDREEKRQNGRRIKEPGEPMFTLTGQDRHGVAIIDDQGRRNKEHIAKDYCPTLRAQTHGNEPKDGYRIRKLTPRECWRLQGFPDWAFDRAAGVNSDSQLYKQAGNSVTVNVIYEIAKKLR